MLLLITLTTFCAACLYALVLTHASLKRKHWQHADDSTRAVPQVDLDILDSSTFYGRPLSQQHGDVYQVRAGGKPALVIASSEVARGFYRSQKHHRRTPSFSVLGLVCSRLLGDAVGTQTGSDWHRHRRPFKVQFGLSQALERDALYRQRSEELAQRVLAFDGPFASSDVGLHRFTLDILSDVVYGPALAERHRDEIHRLAELHDALLPRMGDRATRVPGYRMLPTALNRDLSRFCREWHAFNDRMWDAALQPEQQGSVLAHLRSLHEAGSLNLNRNEVYANLEEILLFNIDVMLSAVGALMHNLATADDGAWQGRLRDELHAFRASGGEGVGPADLPLLDAFITESARTCPSLALSFPECTHEDMVIGGYRVPADTVVLVDALSINHDARTFEQPDQFDPHRFTAAEGPRRKHQFHRFGLGSRRCMGQNYARAILARLVTALVSTVELRLANPSQRRIGPKHTGLAFFTPFLAFPRLVSAPAPAPTEFTTTDPVYAVVTELCGCDVGERVRTQRSGPVIPGLSVNNGYFRRNTVVSLISHLLSRGHDVYPFVPHPPSVSTYRALGHKDSDAKRRARQNGRRLQRWADEGAAQDPSTAARYHVTGWTEAIEAHPAFSQGLEQVLEMYEHDAAFRDAVNDTTLTVVRNGSRADSTLTEEEALAIGSDFLLREMAFLLNVHAIIGVSADTDVAYVYHRRWPVFERLLAGDFTHQGQPVVVPHLGFWCMELQPQLQN